MNRINRILLSFLSGVLLSLAWLGFPGWTLFIAFVPLLFLDNFFVEHKLEYRSVLFWGHAFLAFLIWNVITTWWIMNATIIGAALAIIANSFVMSLVWWLAHSARRNFKSNLGYISIIVIWISFEYFHFHSDIEWPWLNLGNGFANQVKLVQWYEFTGVFGGTLWALILNVLFFKVTSHIVKKLPLLQLFLPFLTIILLITIPALISHKMYSSYLEKENPREIVIVQPNINPFSESYDFDAENKKLETFIQLAKTKADNQTDFIIGPETLFENPEFWNEDKMDSNMYISELEHFIGEYSNAELVFGVSSYKAYPERRTATYTAREKEGKFYDLFNAAVFLGRDGKVQIYHKSILVAGVEKMPYMKYFGFTGDLVIDIGGTSVTLGSQEKPSNFVSKDNVKLAPVICYESVFGEYVTKYVKNGAQLIFVITNDGWWKNTPGYKQHLSFARLRAIETRRSIARAANTGISCFINQRGDEIQKTKWWTEDAVKGTINANSEITFYVKYGDYIARISVFLSTLLVLSLFAQNLIDKKNPHQFHLRKTPD